MTAYIICVNQPGYLPEGDPYEVEGLEAARDAAQDELSRTSLWDDPNRDEDLYRELSSAVQALGANGGVIGPLPDGYVIDVQRLPDPTPRADA